MSAEITWDSFRKTGLNGVVTETHLVFKFSPKLALCVNPDSTVNHLFDKLVVEIRDDADQHEGGRYPYITIRLWGDGRTKVHFTEDEEREILSNFKRTRTISFGPGNEFVLTPEMMRGFFEKWRR